MRRFSQIYWKILSIEYSCLSLIFQSFEIYCLWLDIDCYFRNSMKWTKEHDVLLGKEVMLFELWKYKLGSRERGNCLDRIAESLNQLQKPFFNVSQKTIRDTLRLQERDFKRKDRFGWNVSGISREKFRNRCNNGGSPREKRKTRRGIG